MEKHNLVERRIYQKWDSYFHSKLKCILGGILLSTKGSSLFHACSNIMVFLEVIKVFFFQAHGICPQFDDIVRNLIVCPRKLFCWEQLLKIVLYNSCWYEIIVCYVDFKFWCSIHGTNNNNNFSLSTDVTSRMHYPDV